MVLYNLSKTILIHYIRLFSISVLYVTQPRESSNEKTNTSKRLYGLHKIYQNVGKSYSTLHWSHRDDDNCHKESGKSDGC